MTRKLKAIICLSCSAALVVGAACSLLRKPTLPQTGTVSVRAWIVVAPGESVGTRDNDGCRMTMAEVSAFLNALRSHARMFGGNVCFDPIEVATVQDFGLFLHGRLEPFSAFRDNVLLPYWMADRLNIYFTGAVQSPPPIGLPQAFTEDPSQSPPFGHPYILLNDGGDTLGTGFHQYRTPSELKSYHVLEHEVAHYLLRRSGAPGYDVEEHVPIGSANILWERIRLPPEVPTPDILPLLLPSAEQGETWCRVWNGVWNLPSPECNNF
ncbi:MAG TPA: hypothetical protein VM243_05300 [Phycisphaerae bacterium]|nr:hypothetical protein [Phycisphaerae bacterium]